MGKNFCDDCNKVATIHLTEIVNGKVSEIHLCSDCPKAKELNLSPSFHLSDALAHLAQAAAGAVMPDVACPRCDISYEQFTNVGRLGCENDYEVFKRFLEPYFDKIHNSRFHCGKTPGRATEEAEQVRRLSDLRRRLKTAIDAEDYEHAATLRDEIHSLEKGATESL
jgi:protein arginine kinase activator